MTADDEQSLRDAIGLPRRRQRPLAKGLVLPHPCQVSDLWVALENYVPTWQVNVELPGEWELPTLHVSRLVPLNLEERLVIVAGAFRKGIDQ